MSISRPNGDEAGWADPGETRSPTERASKRRRTLDSTYRDDENQEIGLMRDGDSPGLPRFVGSSSGIHFVRAVYDILARSSGQPSRAHSQLVPGEDDQLDGTHELGAAESPGAAARAPFWRDDETTSREGRGGAGISQLTFEELIQWSQSYFDVWHPAYPFLQGPEVLETLERVADHGIEGVSGSDAAIVRSIISISLADARQLPRGNTPPVPSDLLFVNLDHVASSVSFVLGSPASLKNLQAALAVELFLISILKFNMASRLGGVIVRMAYHLGLHRCPQRYSNFSTHEVIMRKRIWWSFYCLERLICQVLGLPLDVQDDDVDVCLPTTELHRNSAAAVHTPDLGAPKGTSQLQLLTLLSKHAQLRGMILELRHKSLHVREDSMDRALDVQARLTRWSNEVHDTAMGSDLDDALISAGNGSAQSAEDDPFQHYQTLLLILHHESTITLNRPLLAKKPPTPASQAALQACIQASRVIIETLYERGLGPQPANAVDVAARPVIVWPLLTWSVWMSCFILTYAAFEGVTSTASALNYANRTSIILGKLSKRGTAWPTSCAHAVEQLISALKKRKSDSTKVGMSERSLLHNATPTSSRAGRTRHHTSNEPVSHDGIQSWQGGITNKASEVTTPQPQTGYMSYIGTFQASSRPEDVNVMSNIRVAAQQFTAGQPREARTEPAAFPAETTPMSYLTPQYNDLTTTLGEEGWLLDPLSALDFSNFAQAGSSESAMSFNFY